MRRLRFTRVADDRGAVAIVVALLMVALLGSAAISIDVGRLYVERRQLHNGSDAAALALAQMCSGANKLSLADCVTSVIGLSDQATRLAEANKNDGAAYASVLPRRSTDPLTSVRVRTTTRAPDGSTELPLFFAPVLGQDTKTVSAESLATWGLPIQGQAALPITVDICHFPQGLLANALSSWPAQFIQYAGQDIAPDPLCPLTPVSPVGGVQVYRPVPGGFGWLTQAPGQCYAVVDKLIQQTPSAPGNSFPNECASQLDQLRNTVILLPVYDYAGGQGANGWYHIPAFAAFKLTGWRFSGSPALNWNNTSADPRQNCTGDCRGIKGQFTKLVVLDEIGLPGVIDVNGYANLGTLNLGVTAVVLSQ